jgi:hypothetical protein
MKLQTAFFLLVFFLGCARTELCRGDIYDITIDESDFENYQEVVRDIRTDNGYHQFVVKRQGGAIIWSETRFCAGNFVIEKEFNRIKVKFVVSSPIPPTFAGVYWSQPEITELGKVTMIAELRPGEVDFRDDFLFEIYKIEFGQTNIIQSLPAKKTWDSAGIWARAVWTTPWLPPESPRPHYVFKVSERFYEAWSSNELVVTKKTTPPSFLLNPSNAVVAIGAAAKFEAAIAYEPGATLQWFFNGAALPGQTTGALLLDSVSLSDAGAYWLRARNSNGFTDSAHAGLSVGLAPEFQISPQDLSARAGDNALFEAVPNETFLPVTIQWYYNGEPIAETGSRLTIPALLEEKTGTYQARISNALGTALSRAATLTLQEAAPRLVLPETSKTLLETQTLQLSAQIFSHPQAELQWLHNGQPIPGASNSALVLFGIDWLDKGSYQLRASNSAGVATSSPVEVVVNLATFSKSAARGHVSKQHQLVLGGSGGNHFFPLSFETIPGHHYILQTKSSFNEEWQTSQEFQAQAYAAEFELPNEPGAKFFRIKAE